MCNRDGREQAIAPMFAIASGESGARELQCLSEISTLSFQLLKDVKECERTLACRDS